MGWAFFLFLATAWENIPLLVRFAYIYVGIVWVAYAVFYIVLWVYEKEHHLIKRRELSHLNQAYAYYTLLAVAGFLVLVTIISSGNFYVFSEPTTYQVFAAIGSLLMFLGALIAGRARITLNGYWGAGIFKYSNGAKEFVQDGWYRRVRHPIYFGQILLALGMTLIFNNWMLWFFPILGTVINVRRALAEERDLASRIGKEYQDYKDRTHFIVPWLW